MVGPSDDASASAVAAVSSYGVAPACVVSAVLDSQDGAASASAEDSVASSAPAHGGSADDLGSMCDEASCIDCADAAACDAVDGFVGAGAAADG